MEEEVGGWRMKREAAHAIVALCFCFVLFCFAGERTIEELLRAWRGLERLSVCCVLYDAMHRDLCKAQIECKLSRAGPTFLQMWPCWKRLWGEAKRLNFILVTTSWKTKCLTQYPFSLSFLRKPQSVTQTQPISWPSLPHQQPCDQQMRYLQRLLEGLWESLSFLQTHPFHVTLLCFLLPGTCGQEAFVRMEVMRKG